MNALIWKAHGLDGEVTTGWELWLGTESQCDFIEQCIDWTIVELVSLEFENGYAKPTSLERVERDLILKTLQDVEYVQKDAAEILGLTGRAFNSRIVKHEITHPSWPKNNGKKIDID